MIDNVKLICCGCSKLGDSRNILRIRFGSSKRCLFMYFLEEAPIFD